ncbi:MAG: hypothetical protein EP343_21885 [Deltaproteobacteria bacterium]|nr:MAG: hypothetical protein EP343_21885 [Deltaproteobacteria bacterium]
MFRFYSVRSALLILMLCLPWMGCKKKTKPNPKTTKRKATSKPTKRAPEVKLVGLDAKTKTIFVGALNDESGPGAAIGKAFAIGKRVAFAAANAKGGINGWKIKLVEQDHAYNPSKSVQAYGKIKNKVLYIATSFGTPNTLPLRDQLTEDKILAFPASLSSKMAEHTYTPPLATSYKLEAMRAMDWVVKKARKASRVKAAIVYQKDDYGQDGLEGWRAAAKKHGVKIVQELAFSPRDRSFASLIVKLKRSRANYVLMTCLPSATARILGTALKLRYRRGVTWIGNTPSWVDAFFRKKALKPLFGNFYLISSLPYWGEDLPGMKTFLAAHKKFGKGSSPDFYILASYVQGLIQTEILRRALNATKDKLTRESLLAALKTVKKFDGGGLIKPVNLAVFPYVTSTMSRILQPDWKNASWKVVADYVTPSSYGNKKDDDDNEDEDDD